MNHATHNAIVGFIWNIADDVLRDVYVRGKYRDVILPMTVIRRLDCLLEPTQEEVLKRLKYFGREKDSHLSRSSAPAKKCFWLWVLQHFALYIKAIAG